MSMAGYSLQHRFTYWLRTRTPAHTQKAAERVETALHKLIETNANNKIVKGTTAYDRVYLPPRRRGLGYERVSDLRHRAFIGGLLDALPAFINRVYTDDEDDSTTAKGVFHEWTVHAIGEGAYDAEGYRQTMLVGDHAMSSYLGGALMEAWEAVVNTIRESEPTEAAPEEKYMLGTPHMALSETFRRRPKDPDAVAPESDPRQYVSQKTISKNVHQAREQYLPTRFAATEEARNAKRWRQLDRASSAIAWALVSEKWRLGIREYPEAVAAYLLLPSPELVGLQGQHIDQTFPNRTDQTRFLPCDKYGDSLCRATLPGGSWTARHDAVLQELYELAKLAGLECEMECAGKIRAGLTVSRTHRARIITTFSGVY